MPRGMFNLTCDFMRVLISAIICFVCSNDSRVKTKKRNANQESKRAKWVRELKDEREEEEREAKIQVDRIKERQRERRKRRCWKERDHFLGSEPSVQFHVIRTFTTTNAMLNS